MLKHSTRRWLAGLGVAGALVAASATPAVAADEPFEVVAQDILVTPDRYGFAYVSAGSTDPEQSYQFGHTTLDIDYSGISDFAVLETPGEGWEWACETSGQVVHCETDLVDLDSPWLGIYVAGNHDAQPGQTGQLKLAMTSGGRTVHTTSAVTVAETVDLQTSAELNVSGAPGSKVGMPATVRNGSETTSHGAVLLMNGDYLVGYAGNFSNCQDSDYSGVLCTFDEDLEPGKSYRLSAELPFQLQKDVRTDATLLAGSVWWTKDDWKIISADWPQDGKPGTGEKLRLVEQAGARALTVPQTDPDMMSNYTDISVRVTGNNPADLSAKGATASGKKGDVVQVRPSATNLGPALLEYQGRPAFRVTVPEGTTAVEVSGECQPYTSDDEWDQWNGNWGEPGAKEYGCQITESPKDFENPYEFSLRIDKVIPNASGAVSVRLAGDPNSKNDNAKIVINPTGNGGGDGGQGGGDGDGGALPITGESTGLIAGIGALLLVAGAGGYLVAKRRRTRFVA
ncbi:LPXTG cell wall anchor domain-containing protein [Micromonospora sp. WMMD812]|uniref:LPXTG cell wall anchor domain-containing protein n=1 Tax=Micromonospora sp. WMMD812 TaxID=3015152 RepID=UPI00248C0A3D|nr:LPXTG cell wall anchor domain-containing protein [Micromonospora sp. WMMD812]WBB65625.1 LPXTG cell wall anchor domain-containing protein [Micromonospora sp. WMMD812]